MLLFRVGDLLGLAASAGRLKRPAIRQWLTQHDLCSSSSEKAIGLDRTAGGSGSAMSCRSG